LTAVPCQPAAAHVSQAATDGVGRLDVGDDEGLLEAGAARKQVALLVEQERLALEDQLILAAHRVAERDEARVVARACGEHLLAFAVAEKMKGRGGEID